TSGRFGSEENPPVRVYDTSGPYTDLTALTDVRQGLPPLRRNWILERGDVEAYDGREVQPRDNGFKPADPRANMAVFPGLNRRPLRAKPGRNVTQMHYARRGIITPEMEFIALRENMGRALALHAMREHTRADRSSLFHEHRGESFGARIPDFVTPDFVRDALARG